MIDLQRQLSQLVRLADAATHAYTHTDMDTDTDVSGCVLCVANRVSSAF